MLLPLLLSPWSHVVQETSPRTEIRCKKVVSENAYNPGDTLNINLRLSAKAGVSHKAQLSLTSAESLQTAPISLIAFGVEVNKGQTRFSFQIPLSHLSGLYLISGLTVSEVPGGDVSVQSKAFDEILGTCVRFSDHNERGVSGIVEGGFIEPKP